LAVLLIGAPHGILILTGVAVAALASLCD